MLTYLSFPVVFRVINIYCTSYHCLIWKLYILCVIWRKLQQYTSICLSLLLYLCCVFNVYYFITELYIQQYITITFSLQNYLLFKETYNKNYLYSLHVIVLLVISGALIFFSEMSSLSLIPFTHFHLTNRIVQLMFQFGLFNILNDSTIYTVVLLLLWWPR